MRGVEFIDFFLPERCEPAFHLRVVIALSDVAHALNRMKAAKHFLVLPARVLAPRVAENDGSGFREAGSLSSSLFQFY